MTTGETRSLGSSRSAVGEGCELPLDFDIGAEVFCSDGRCGKLMRVVIDPATDNVTDLIVGKGFLQRKDRVVPVSAVAGAAGDAIHLNLASRDVKALPEYREIEFRVPAAGWESSRYKPENVRYWMTNYGGIADVAVVPARKQRLHTGVSFDLRVVGSGTPVHDAEGTLGEVDHVLVDCKEAHVTHLVVRRGLFRDYRIVPVELVVRVDESGIYLTPGLDRLSNLTLYRPRGR